MRQRLLAEMVRTFRGDPNYTAYASRGIRDGVGHVVADLVVRRKHGPVHLFRLEVDDTFSVEEAERSWRPIAEEARKLGARAWIVVPSHQKLRAEAIVAQERIPANIRGYDAPFDGPIRFDWPRTEVRAAAFRPIHAPAL